MNRSLRLALILSLCLIAAGIGMTQLGWLLYTGGPYQGQLVDAETHQPLEGAVVLFYWDHDVYGSPGGPVSTFLKAKEILTDKEGRFYIPWFIGLSPSPFSIVRWQPGLTIFYPGYRAEPGVVTPSDGKPFRDPTLIPMRKLTTRDERIRAVRGLPPSRVPDQAMPNLIRLVNVERIALGLKPVRVRVGGGR